jgi:hypothetical protein
MKTRFADMIIPDAELQEYLKGKLLVKPEYGPEVGPTEIESDFAAVQKRLDEMRRADNEKVKKDYRLKGKK